VSLTKCKECGQQISSKAEKCPHCGKPHSQSGTIIGGIVWLAVVVLIIYSLEKGENPISVLKGLWSNVLKPSKVEEWIKTEAEKYAKKSFEGTPIVYKKIGGVRKESLFGDDYTAMVIADIPDYNDRVFILEIKGFKDNCAIRWDAQSFSAILKLSEAMSE
jgi:hypothetical protein